VRLHVWSLSAAYFVLYPPARLSVPSVIILGAPKPLFRTRRSLTEIDDWRRVARGTFHAVVIRFR
jgi:hypothetical protein